MAITEANRVDPDVINNDAFRRSGEGGGGAEYFCIFHINSLLVKYRMLLGYQSTISSQES